MKRTTREVALFVGGELVGDAGVVITGINSIEDAVSGDLTFANTPKHVRLIEKTNASCVITPKTVEKSSKTIIRTENPSMAFAKILNLIQSKAVKHPQGIHPSAIIDKGASLGKNTAVGAGAVISGTAKVGDNTVIYAGSYIGPGAKIGSSCVVYPNVVVGERISIGNNCVIHSGTIVGTDGFGYHQVEDKHIKIPQLGTVVIEDDVEVGSCVTIDRATLGQTVIGKGTKIDNLVQIAHNVKIGPNCVIVAQTGISGSSTLGRNVMLGGQVGLTDHISLGDKVMVGAKGGVTNSFPAGSIVIGIPAKPYQEARKIIAATSRLPQLTKRVAELEKKLTDLEKNPAKKFK